MGQAYADNGKMIEGVKRIVQVNKDYPIIFEGVNVLDEDYQGVWKSFDKDYQ
jgi:hypothetical protein